MPEYVYRAVTRRGQIVRNKVEESSKNTLVKKLKSNDLMPIEVIQVSYRSKKSKVPKKNIIDIDGIMKIRQAYFKVEKIIDQVLGRK